jgi:hypothetical protein
MADELDRGPDIPHGTDEENSRIGREPHRKPKIEEPRDDLNEDPLRGGNPPRTTSGGITAPKFGSAGSGGAELEPGPERD